MVDASFDTLPYIKEEIMPKLYTLFTEGDVAFADASEDTNDVAKAIEIINCDSQQIVSGLHTIHDVTIPIKQLLATKAMLLRPKRSTNRSEESLRERKCFL